MERFMERSFKLTKRNVYAARHKCMCDATVVDSFYRGFPLFYYVDVFAGGKGVRLSFPICRNAHVDLDVIKLFGRHLLENFRETFVNSVAIGRLLLPQVPTSVVVVVLDSQLERVDDGVLIATTTST